MSIFDSNIISLMSDKMAYLGQRQAVLAQNIANSDTPGYKAKDLTPFTFNDAMREASSGMMVTNQNHITPGEMTSGPNSGFKLMKGYETMPSGNSVDLEQQAMQVSKTAIEYQAVSAVYKKMTGWFRLALGRNSGA
ncbi:MAG: flagellar basal body rod protein FlgB [Alphaproteobacteria bacterium]|nr:flagellar basal body rod protein FlgB [Alphaproteobacteria bacterium]